MGGARATSRGSGAGSWRWGALALVAAACGGDDGDGNGSETTAATGAMTSTASTDGPGTTLGTTTADPSSGPLDSGTDDPTTGNPTTGDTPASCGDGMLDEGEACDDGNDVDSDGCNVDCTISGSVLWHHTQAGGADQSEEAFGIAVDLRGRAYVGGEMWGGTDFDLWVRQYEDDALGWTQLLDGGGGNAGARALALHGNTLYAAGYRVVAGQSNDVWLRSFGLDGSVGWAVDYNDALSGSNVGQGVATDPGGNVIVAANESVGDPLAPQADAWIREYTPAGAPVWTVGYGGAAAATDSARAVATDATGRVAVVGIETVAGQGTDMWIRVYDTNGGMQWTATYANVNALDDEATAVAFDGDGNVIVAGYELDPVIPWRLWLTKYDPAGGLVWTQTWDGELLEGARAFGVAVDDTGDIVVTGQHRAMAVNQLLVRKLDPGGNERWTTRIDGFAGTNQVGRAVAIGPGRRVWVAGGVDQGVDGRDAYVARLAP
jgi:cysteine-rich repeat protein